MTMTFLRLPFAALAALMMIVLSSAQPQAAASCPVASFVQSAGNAYDSAARNGSPAAFANAAGRFTDLRALSFFALGRYRKDLPKAREAEYLALTRKFIGEFMQDYGKGFRASELAITGCKVSGNSYVVNGKLSTGGSVIFRVSKSGRPSITDINMKGVWLAQQMRSTFVGTISRTGSIDGLFKYLKS